MPSSTALTDPLSFVPDASTGGVRPPSGVDDLSRTATDAYKKLLQEQSKIGIPGGGTAASTISAGAEQVAQGKIGENTANEMAAIKLKEDTTRFAAMFGLTPGAPSALVVQMSKDIMQGQAEVITANKGITDKLQTSFLSDPLGWISNQITLPFDVQAVENRAAQVNQEFGFLGELQDKISNQGKLNAIIDTGASTDRLNALNQQALGIAKVTAGQSAMESAKLGLEGARIRSAMTAQAYHAAIDMDNVMIAQYNIAKTDKQIAFDQAYKTEEQNMQEQRLVIVKQKELRDIELDAVRLNNEKMNSKILSREIEGTADTQRRLDIANALAGYNRLSVTEFQKLPAGGIKDYLEKAIVDPNFMNGRYGFDPVESLSTLRKYNLPISPGARLVADKLAEIEGKIVKQDEINWRTLGSEAQKARLMVGIKDYWEKEIIAIPESGSIYSPPSLAAVIAIPALTNLSLLKDLSGAAIANPNYAFKVDDLITAAIFRVNEKKSTPSQMAEEISAIYNSIMVDNNNNYQYTRFALPPMSQKDTKFRQIVNVDPSNPYIKDSYDMSNTAVVEGLLTKIMTYKIRTQQMKDLGPALDILKGVP